MPLQRLGDKMTVSFGLLASLAFMLAHSDGSQLPHLSGTMEKPTCQGSKKGLESSRPREQNLTNNHLSELGNLESLTPLSVVPSDTTAACHGLDNSLLRDLKQRLRYAQIILE